jgi:hypothetical protein
MPFENNSLLDFKYDLINKNKQNGKHIYVQANMMKVGDYSTVIYAYDVWSK